MQHGNILNVSFLQSVMSENIVKKHFLHFLFKEYIIPVHISLSNKNTLPFGTTVAEHKTIFMLLVNHLRICNTHSLRQTQLSNYQFRLLSVLIHNCINIPYLCTYLKELGFLACEGIPERNSSLIIWACQNIFVITTPCHTTTIKFKYDKNHVFVCTKKKWNIILHGIFKNIYIYKYN